MQSRPRAGFSLPGWHSPQVRCIIAGGDTHANTTFACRGSHAAILALAFTRLLDPVFRSVAKGVLFLGLVQTILETIFLCSGSDKLFGMVFASMLLFIFTAILALAFTPLVGILVSVILGQAASGFMSFIRSMDEGCVK